MPAFLAALEETGNILASARAAKVSEAAVYRVRNERPEFEEKVKEAKQMALVKLEEEARRRAVKGTKEDVFYQGVKCGEKFNYSDTLLIFLMKAADPEKYRERYSAEISGKLEVDLAETLNKARNRLAKEKQDNPTKED